MSDDESRKTAYERAARAIHEGYKGAESWKQAEAAERSHARQIVRLVVATLEKNGLTLSAGAQETAPAAGATSLEPITSRPERGRPTPRRPFGG